MPRLAASAPEVALSTANPARLWLVAYGRDHSQGALTAPEFTGWLNAHYRQLDQVGYGETSPLYRAIKERLLHRPAYADKMTVTLYERLP